MNENIFDVLMYLFEHYMIEDIGHGPLRADIEDELFRLGFSNVEVGNAFGWFDGLIEQCRKQEYKTNTQANVADVESIPNDSQESFDDIFSFETLELNHHKENKDSWRYYLPIEQQRISVATRGLLYTLEQSNVIDHKIREIIIDRIMAIAANGPLKESRAKWVIMMVLTNCHDINNDENYRLDLAESLVFNDSVKH